MNGLTKLTAGVLMAMAAGQAMAVDGSVDVKVKGTIVPPACVPTVSGGTVFDYGTIKAASVKADEFNILAQKKAPFSIVCDAPTKIAFKTVDQRNGSAIQPTGMIVTSRKITDDIKLPGLGLANGRNVGAFSVTFGNIKIDTGNGSTSPSVDGIYTDDNGSSWVKSQVLVSDSTLIFLDNDGNRMSSLSEKGTLTPIALKTMTGNIWLQAVLNKGAELDLTKVNNLDGLTSIQIVYI